MYNVNEICKDGQSLPLSTEGNLRALVQDYIDALNNNDFNLVKKYIDEKSLTELTPIFEDKSKKSQKTAIYFTYRYCSHAAD